ncbi:MAG: hypothetical protein JWM61_2450 [Micrococcaceae bacterium]|jgi:hypothetical protein|nr:hypothetical protein [Micrococcaceae bacterium]
MLTLACTEAGIPRLAVQRTSRNDKKNWLLNGPLSHPPSAPLLGEGSTRETDSIHISVRVPWPTFALGKEMLGTAGVNLAWPHTV